MYGSNDSGETFEMFQESNRIMLDGVSTFLPGTAWSIVYVSPDGSVLCATTLSIGTNLGRLLCSLDRGLNWTTPGNVTMGSATAKGIAISADGRVLGAVNMEYVGSALFPFYISTDYGATFTGIPQSMLSNNANDKTYGSIAMSQNGSVISVTSYSSLLGRIWISTDSGSTWTPRGPANVFRWFRSAMSSDGTLIAAINSIDSQ